MRHPWDTLLATARQRMHWAWEAWGPRVAVCWTAGKDSTVALHLWREVVAAAGARPLAVTIDTGWKFPEIREFRQRLAGAWDVDLRVFTPQEISLPVAADPVQCCAARKVLPLRRAVQELGLAALIIGVRADEHPERAATGWQWEVDGHVRIAPLLEWSEVDIWTYHAWAQIPWCPLYDQGYRSLGCVPCTSRSHDLAERSGRDLRKETHMASLRSLGYF
ncbi:MAG: phosphoadenosine phosphosulfate reductase family protein [Desulfomicrobiaceae bacterium]